MAKIVQPTSGRITQCTISGVDLSKHVNQVEIFEDICKPYLTGRVKILIDNPNIQNLVLKGSTPGTPVTITLDSGVNTYTAELLVAKKNAADPSPSGKSQFGILELIGPEFYKDKNLVTKAIPVGQVPTAAISSIHKMFMGTSLSVLIPAINVLAKETSHIIDNKNVITAIRGLAGISNYAQFSPGTTLYFRDKDKAVLAPLGFLFQSTPILNRFIQSFTTGKNWQEQFGGGDAYRTIMSVTPMSQGGSIPGGDGINEIAGAAKQMNFILDTNSRDIIKKLPSFIKPNKFAGDLSGFLGNAAKIIGNIASAEGTQPNYHVRNGRNQGDKGSNYQLSTPEGILSSAAAQNGPSYSIRVPTQGALDIITVGQRIYCNFLEAPGEFKKTVSSMDGEALVTKIRHSYTMGENVKNPAICDIAAIKGGTYT